MLRAAYWLGGSSMIPIFVWQKFEASFSCEFAHPKLLKSAKMAGFGLEGGAILGRFQ